MAGKVGQGETLSNILSSHDVSYNIINEVERISKPIINLRKIRAGNSYFIINELKSIRNIKYLIYEQNSIDYVVFKLEAPLDVFTGKRKVKTKKKITTGIIKSSLYDALTGTKFRNGFAEKLTQLYENTLDFHHIQKGDYFKAIYNEEYVGEKSVALGKILAVCFNHRGQDFYAFYFEQESGAGYYDHNGRSLESCFLKSPLKYTVITSRYSEKRLHPILKFPKPHLGVDYAAPAGTPIMSVGDGIIKKTAYHREYGNYVKIMHNGIYSTQYLHMSKIAEKISPGVFVQKGDIIGYVGSTGLATGPHVELRLLKNGKPVDPLKEEMPTAKPIKKEYTEAFRNHIFDFKTALDNLELSDKSLTVSAKD
jgi:murein DD-endopeptidase MepM/ murein hydrolase activator NlpD